MSSRMHVAGWNKTHLSFLSKAMLSARHLLHPQPGQLTSILSITALPATVCYMGTFLSCTPEVPCSRPHLPKQNTLTLNPLSIG